MKLEFPSKADGLSDEELHRAVVDIQKQRDQLEAAQARLLSAWDARKVWAADGSRSAASRYARETGLSLADAKHLRGRAKRLQSMPLTLERFSAGELSSSRVDLLVRVNQPRVRAAFERDEQMLLELISPMSFGDTFRAVRYWSHCADESGAENRAARLVEQRSASAVKTYEGSVDLRALFDPVSGEIFLDELERLDRSLFEQDWAEGKVVHGDDVRVEHLKRTPAQRRCDALVLMAERSATLRSDSRKPVPLVSILVGEKAFENTCELISGTVVTPGQLVPWLIKADIERIVFDGPSRVLDISHQRSFRGALRKAIQVRDRHCQHPSGCDEPAKNCDVDHVMAYANGGVTLQGNGQLLCPTHNRAKGSGPP